MRRALGYGLGAALALGSWSPTAAAQEPTAQEPSWLTWQAPPECPSAPHIAENLEGWLKRPFSPEEAQVTATVRSSDGGWEVSLLVVRGELRGERSVRTRTCVEAADFVALSVALAVDPAISGELPEAAAAAPEASPPADPTPAEASSTRPSEPAATKPGESRELPPKSEPAHEQETTSGFRFRAQAGMSADFFSLPTAQLGVAAHLGGSIGRAFVLLGGEWLPPATDSVPNAMSDVTFSRLTGELRLGYALTQNDVEVAPFVVGQLGQIFTESDEYWSYVPWMALGGGGQVTWLASDWFQPFGSLSALVPLEQRTFVLSGGTEVHQVPALTLEAAVGARALF